MAGAIIVILGFILWVAGFVSGVEGQEAIWVYVGALASMGVGVLIAIIEDREKRL